MDINFVTASLHTLASDPEREWDPVAGAVWAVLLVALGLWLGSWWIRFRSPGPVQPPAGPRFSVVMAAALAYLMALLVLTTVFPPMEVEDTVARLRLALRLAMVALAAAGAAALVANQATGGAPRDLGLRLDRPHRALTLALVTYVVIWPTLMGAALCKSVLLEWLGQEVPRQLAVETIEQQEVLHSDALFLGGVIVVQPFLEELLYRGVLMAFLLRYLRPGAAVVLNSALFAVVHDAGRLEVFVLSLGLAWLYHRTRSLWAPTLMHVLHNGVNILILIQFGDPFS